MEIRASFGPEKFEVETILASGIFHRAPNLANLLSYVCTKYFEGAAEEIKEYNIAVEALGRPPDFDQKRDSIVRVEAHRLRKRLREYYESDGAAHAVRIEIPSGQYAPKFIYQETALTNEPVETSLALAAPSDLELLPPMEDGVVRPSPVGFPASRHTWLLAALAVFIGCAAAAYVTFHSNRRGSTAPATDLAIAPPGEQVRIVAGAAGNYVDAFGNTWTGDRFFTGGSVFRNSGVHPISGTKDARLYQNRREGAFGYDIPLKPGVYEMRLHFAETLYGENNIAGGGETSRIFQVLANGAAVLRNFDVIEDAGPSAADVKVFKDVRPASDGKLHLRFEPIVNPAFLNAIEILPGIPGRLRPIRIVARDRAFTDSAGREWEADRYVRGGQQVVRNEPISNTPDPELYHGERFGNLTYSIPVTQLGRYRLTLYFAETWFGPGLPGGGGAGSRIFDILCNGVALRRNFDLFREAGGSNRAFAVTFHGINPSPQGKLVVSLVPRENYAAINALEIVDESE